ncbi:hypothetical protein, partial [Thiolapillus sp.]|uniref:hypothetical protein n=1 Tax=Thiolapillus sp. TaxID=2017437 RepID=UPI003AF912E9
AGLCAALLASVPLCWPLCRSAGLCAALLASVPLCWPLCRSAAVLLAFWSTGRQPPAFSLSANAWCFAAGGYIAACC